MIFATYIHNNRETIGLISDDFKSILPLDHILIERGISGINAMNSLIEVYDNKFQDQITQYALNASIEKMPIEHIQLVAPIPYPKRNVICLGKNYAEHAKEVKSLTSGHSDLPEHPIYFTKTAYPIVGHNATILRHENATSKIDYEVELAVIIGKEGINIPKDKAYDYIFGYSIGNDISARDLQTKHVNWFKGKSLQTHCVLGPWIVHKNLIPYPDQLDIKCWVNDELRQNSNTSHLIFDIPYIISDLSKGMPLLPGDIILTGTPAGVGLGFKPPKYLNPGDKVQCYIEKIGSLVNYIEK